MTFDAFCETHERAWVGLARARLADEGAARRALAEMQSQLWRTWSLALRQPAPAGYAWLLLKEQVANAAAEVVLKTGLPPAPRPVPDWVEAVCHYAGCAGTDDHERLYDAILGLPERQYDILVLRCVLALPDRTIADYLGSTEGSVRSIAGQAVGRLARTISRGRDGAHE
jgi:DNA-directed RNA polymerase specialized sigma24 family protein